MTARVKLIISKTDAIDPRVRPPCPLLTMLSALSSSTFGRLVGFAAFSNVCKESLVIELSDLRPGCLVLKLV